jgi:hypothetical protein
MKLKTKMLVKKSVIPTQLELKGVLAFNGTFNDISVILWGSVLLVVLIVLLIGLHKTSMELSWP